MALSPRDLRTVGTVIAVVIFVGPLAIMYISTKSWKAELQQEEARKAAEEQRERDSRRRARVRGLPRKTTRTAVDGDTKKDGSTVEQETSDGALKIVLKRESRYVVEIVYENVSGDKMRLAVPDAPGGLLRIGQVGRPLGRAAGELFDEDRDDYVLPLKAGGAHAVKYKKYNGFPVGKIRATYDSRGNGMPAQTWRGKAESNIVPELE